ncbi:MAG TPA: rhodanese-like domain-containing protein [Bryobacteraceae bacterium]|jgi:rhodanese-related sulfurtransferase|nr:rhodanese-like domain-containing protein [Bryobacteraceae bacterium]
MIPALLMLLFAAQSEPWTSADLIQPAALATAIREKSAPPIFFVGFPVLWRAAHIPGAPMDGPASKDEGLAALKAAVRDIPHDRELVIYCGCCPMDHCPNIRPAFRMLHEMGFTHVRVLEIPTNMRTDWIDKGYPTERP